MSLANSNWIKLEVVMSLPTLDMIKLLIFDLKRSKHLAKQCLQLQLQTPSGETEVATTHQRIKDRIDKLLQDTPNNKDALILKCFIIACTGDFVTAHQIAKRVVLLFPHDPFALMQRGFYCPKEPVVAESLNDLFNAWNMFDKAKVAVPLLLLYQLTYKAFNMNKYRLASLGLQKYFEI